MTDKAKIKGREKEVFATISAHLKKYNKVEKIDEKLISDAAFCLAMMEECKEEIRDKGTIITAKTGWGQKSPYQTAYEGYLRYYISLCSELGLSPKAREKWEKKQPTENKVEVK